MLLFGSFILYLHIEQTIKKQTYRHDTQLIDIKLRFKKVMNIANIPFVVRIKTFFTQDSPNQKPQHKKIVSILWVLFLFPLLSIVAIFTLISLGAFGFMPTFEELENPKSNLAAEIYSSDQKLLGKFYHENRTTVSFDDISINLVEALVATEDERFYDHSGIDLVALGRVAYGLMTFNRKGGGSTVSQQLAKNLFPRDTYDNSFFVIRAAATAIQKFKEWVTAVKLERRYTKDEILVMYLNTVTFGHGAYGIKSAARIFFDKTPAELNVEEAAVLVGMLKAPSYYSPKRNAERSTLRRNVVMHQMLKNEFLTNAEFDSLKQMPITLHYRTQSHSDGLATYFREYLRAMLQKKEPIRDDYSTYGKYKEDSIAWADNPLYGWCNKTFKADGSTYNIYNDGLKIYTTIDSRMQTYAEKAVVQHLATDLQPTFFKSKKNDKKAPFAWDASQQKIDKIIYNAIRWSERYRVMHMADMDSADIMANFKIPVEMTVFKWKSNIDVANPPEEYYEEVDTIMSPLDSILYYKFYLRAGFLAIDPANGHVKAYVGGMSYNHFKYDHVNTGRRQVGSTFKPIIYTLAMINGLSPCTKIMNIPYTFDKMPEGQPPYTPQYSSSKLENQPISLKFGLANSLNQISAYILKQYTPEAAVNLARLMGIESPIDAVPSLCVGAADIYLSEMVGAYTTYVNKGFYSSPVYVTRIEDRNGNVLSTFKSKQTEVLNEETAYLMIELMKGVTTMGTSVRLRGKYKLTNEIAGKTGTTNDNSDGWFIGMVPNLVAGAWVGGEDRAVHFNSTNLGQGANMALPIWGLFIQQCYADKSLNVSQERFPKPNKELSVEIDCNKGEVNQEEDVFDLSRDVFSGISKR